VGFSAFDRELSKFMLGKGKIGVTSNLGRFGQRGIWDVNCCVEQSGIWCRALVKGIFRYTFLERGSEQRVSRVEDTDERKIVKDIDGGDTCGGDG